MLPKRLSASQSTKTTNPLAVRTNSHPVLVIVHPSASEDAEASEEVLTNPQTRNATAAAAVTPNTTRSTPEPFGRRSSTVVSRAGCGTTSAAGELRASTARWAAGDCWSVLISDHYRVAGPEKP